MAAMSSAFCPAALEIGGLSGFSEFHSRANFVNAAERRFLRDFPFDDGPILDVGANLRYL